MSNDNSNNYESLYNNLKEEYEQSKKDNDEICKEYESTIQLLTDSVESMKKEKKELQIKLTKIENEQKAFKREKDTLIKKNKDKIIDIQCLNEQNDKLNKIIKKLKEEKSIFDNKIVTLENDIDHYQNKIREYEDFIDELKAQLEDALEDNITLQTEFETYKLNTDDQLIRKEEELRNIRNDSNNKDKIIQRLTKNPERYNIQKEQKKLINDKRNMKDKSKRRYTVLEKNNDFKFRRSFQKHLTHIKEYQNDNNYNYNNKNIEETKDVNKKNMNKDLNKDLNVIMEDTSYNKTFYSFKTFQKKVENEKENNNNEEENNENKEINYSKIYENSNHKSDINKILNFNEDSDHNNETNERKDSLYDKKDNHSTTEQNNTKNNLSTLINKQFGELVICEENKLYVNPLVNKLLTKEQKKNFKDALKNMLNRIKERKGNLHNKKNTIKELFEKCPFRIK